MTDLLKVPTDSGGLLIVEVDDDEPGFEPAGLGDGAIAEAKRKFEDSLRDVRAAADSALRVFVAGPSRPQSVELEFGIRLNAEAGAIFAKTALEGHLAVKLTWQCEPTGEMTAEKREG